MARRKQKATRPRGGASVPCPKCAGNTSVVVTNRDENSKVVRLRKCLRCSETFRTLEAPVEVIT